MRRLHCVYCDSKKTNILKIRIAEMKSSASKQTNKNLNQIPAFVVFLFGLGGVFWGVLKMDNQICNE